MRIVLFTAPDASLELTGDGETVTFQLKLTRRIDGRLIEPKTISFSAPADELVHQINLVTEPADDKEMTVEEVEEQYKVEAILRSIE